MFLRAGAWARRCARPCAACRVSPRRAIYFLCFAKESSQRKATPLSSSLRYAAGNLRCSQPLGVAQTRPAGSNSARPLIQRLLRSSAQTEGGWESYAPSLRSARVDQGDIAASALGWEQSLGWCIPFESHRVNCYDPASKGVAGSARISRSIEQSRKTATVRLQAAFWGI